AVLLADGPAAFLAATTPRCCAGSAPYSVAVGVFNGDGKPDLAVANLGGGVTIRLGDGTGAFPDASSSTVGAGFAPRCVAVGDFNGDGKPDLAVANSSGKVTVQLNTCDASPCAGISFAPPTGSPFGARTAPESVAVGGFNGDGKPHLAVANAFSNNTTILLGDSLGGFTQPARSPVFAGSFPVSVAVGDFNGDGKLDLAVANLGTPDSSSTVTILLGDGAGAFPTTSTVGAGSLPESVAVWDFNGDGKPDLAVANRNGGHRAIPLGDGLGGLPHTP